jgi:hypothetical protein
MKWMEEEGGISEDRKKEIWQLFQSSNLKKQIQMKLYDYINENKRQLNMYIAPKVKLM